QVQIRVQVRHLSFVLRPLSERSGVLRQSKATSVVPLISPQPPEAFRSTPKALLASGFFLLPTSGSLISFLQSERKFHQPRLPEQSHVETTPQSFQDFGWTAR